MQAHSMPFSKVIDIDQGAREHFHVPKYQREYTWGRKEWEQLLLDIDENDPGYFMGSLICVKDGVDPVPGDELIYEVVDGQQRLTTLSLLLMAIYTRLSKALDGYEFEDADEEEDVRNCQASIKSKLLKRKKDPRPGELGGFSVGKSTYFLRVQPSAQNHNLDDYRYILDEIGLLDGVAKPPYCRLRVLYKTFAYFQDHLPLGVQELCALTRKINQLNFVQITVGSQSDAFTLFESLNNRGVPLSAIDIIKNKMLAEMERQHRADIDESFEKWQAIIGALPDVSEQERFLRHFYNALKHRDSIRVEKVTRATKSQVIRIYEALIRRDAKAAFDELTTTAEVYGNLLRPVDSLGRTTAGRLVELQRIGAAPVYQVLLYLFSLNTQDFTEPDFLEKAVDLVAKYYVRRNVTDMPATRDLDPAHIEVIESCARRIAANEKLSFEFFSDRFLEGRGKTASLEDFKRALQAGIYASNSGMARYLLIQIDLMHHTREYSPDLWARDDKNRYIWTVEHVLPQAEKLPKHWTGMIAGGDPNRAAEIQERWVDCLGNLTPSGYNSDLATSSFQKKQQLAENRTFLGHKINIGYQNGLALNNLQFTYDGRRHTLADAPSWSPEMIRARTDVMVELLLEQNKLPRE
jgi:Protein of unknown function DUF262/Protein of unknown function (DUF1524)